MFLMVALAFSEGIEGIIASRRDSFLKTQQKLLFKELNEKCGLTIVSWDNAEHTQMRYATSFSDEVLTFCGYRVVEMVFRFTDRLILDSCQISIYNRGDCGPWTMARFESTQKGLAQAIGKLTKVRQPLESKRKLDGTDIQQLVWRTRGYDMALRWCASKESTEYITIQIVHRNEIQDLRSDLRASVRAGELNAQVRKEHNGARWIDVPMVNQGFKGYCVVAVLERLMKYYNSSIDQHILAQIMDSDPSTGTDLERGLEAIEENAPKLRILVKNTYTDKSLRTVKELEQVVNDYNRLASKQKAKKVNWDGLRMSGYDLRLFLTDVDDKLFLKMRAKREPGTKRLMQRVKESIDRGVPIVWSVIIMPGDLKEQPMASFHARLINGYNEKTNEIIYTDSWGAGHERHTMPAERAWAVTMRLLTIRPR